MCKYDILYKDPLEESNLLQSDNILKIHSKSHFSKMKIVKHFITSLAVKNYLFIWKNVKDITLSG